VATAIRLGTRGSALAVAQSTAVARDLEALGAEVEVVTIRTSGDEPSRVTSGQNTSEKRPASAGEPSRGTSGQSASATRPASAGEPSRGTSGQSTSEKRPASDGPAVEDKARFVKELEQALLAGAIDLAVHSAKDVPAELPDGLEIVAVPERADARDALCLASGLATASPGHEPAAPTAHSPAAQPLDRLPERATVGTASLRRRAELLALRPDLHIRELRGNVDTRLRRLAEGELDAIVLAAAGLLRLGRTDAGTPLPELTLIPAAGQGCLALEARADDDATRRLACRLTDPRAFACLTAERTLVTAIGATCHTPVGAHATIENHTIMRLDAFVGTPDGTRWIRDDVRGLAEDPRAVGADAASRLVAAGAADILASAEA
jgi:hydroxymethylbilane synthase